MPPVPRAPRQRRALLAMLGTAAAAAAALPIVAAAGPGGVSYPNLRSDPPKDPYTEVYSNSGLGVSDRYLMRFWGFVVNVGEGPLDIAGDPSSGGVRQRGATSGGAWQEIGSPTVLYERADGHNHFHLKNAVAYSLRTGAGDLVAPAQKTGFCLYDSNRVTSPAAAQYYTDSGTTRVIDFCRQGQPNATSLRMGVSSGWRDDYNPTLAFQWVDISNVAPGDYRLQAVADPDGQINEGGGSRESNPANGTTAATVPGYLAQNVSATHAGAPVTVRLGATRFGSPGELRYRVVQAPANGTLNRAVGEVFSDPNVVYTPRAGSQASDTFRYVALNRVSGGAGGAAGDFPLSPPQATATVAGTDIAVAIGGAPAMLYAGTSAALSASVANAGPGVAWSVNGVPGGNAGSGTITPAGVYTAPASPPPGGRVTVRATSADQPAAYAEVVIAIQAPPAPAPAPSPVLSQVVGRGGVTAVRPKGPLSKPVVRRVGRSVVASVLPRKGGRVVITGVAGKRRYLGRCVIPAAPGRVATCRIRLPRGVKPASVRMIAVLRAKDGTRVSTRARVVSRRG